MCFSATASFTVAAVLVPVGTYCLSKARQIDRKWLALAIYPIAFSIQQAAEGFVWLGLSSGDQRVISEASKVFLFFSHFFWLAWVPFSIAQLDAEPWRRKFFFVLAIVGGISGLTVFLPLLLMPDWLSVQSVSHSIEYNTVLIYDGIVSRTVMRTGYGFVIATALLVSSDVRIRVFGGLIVGSLLVAHLYFFYALISVWCFFAAMLSASIAAILTSEHRNKFAPA